MRIRGMCDGGVSHRSKVRVNDDSVKLKFAAELPAQRSWCAC